MNNIKLKFTELSREAKDKAKSAYINDLLRPDYYKKKSITDEEMTAFCEHNNYTFTEDGKFYDFLDLYDN